MRIAVSNWSTTESDIEMSAAAILRCAEAATALRVQSFSVVEPEENDTHESADL